MLPTALSDADKSLDSNLTPHSWVNRVSDDILAEIILGRIRPPSSLTVVIIRLQIPRWGKKILPLGSCHLCWLSFLLPSPHSQSRGNIHSWSNDHIIDSLLGSHCLPIIVESWYLKEKKEEDPHPPPTEGTPTSVAFITRGSLFVCASARLSTQLAPCPSVCLSLNGFLLS